MEIYKGIATFSGIAIGKVLYYSRGEYQIRQCLVSNIKKEISDFQEDLDALKKNIQDNTRSMEVRLASISEAVKETQTSFLSRFQEQKEQDKMDDAAAKNS